MIPLTLFYSMNKHLLTCVMHKALWELPEETQKSIRHCLLHRWRSLWSNGKEYHKLLVPGPRMGWKGSRVEGGGIGAAADCLATLDSGVGVQERLLTRESILGTWPALGSPSTGRRQERTLDRGPGTHHLLLTFLPLPTNSHLRDRFQQKLEVSIMQELSFFHKMQKQYVLQKQKKKRRRKRKTHHHPR